MHAGPRGASVWPSERLRHRRSHRLGRRSVIARLVQSVDFERVLRTRSHAHSRHFAVHRLTGRPDTPRRPASGTSAADLSTAQVRTEPTPVDDYEIRGPVSAPSGLWWGAVVPKRHARRAVTRSLLKRQIRAAMQRHAGALAAGLWVVRLRAPFDRQTFVSAASDALKRCARDELDALL